MRRWIVWSAVVFVPPLLLVAQDVACSADGPTQPITSTSTCSRRGGPRG